MRTIRILDARSGILCNRRIHTRLETLVLLRIPPYHPHPTGTTENHRRRGGGSTGGTLVVITTMVPTIQPPLIFRPALVLPF